MAALIMFMMFLSQLNDHEETQLRTSSSPRIFPGVRSLVKLCGTAMFCREQKREEGKSNCKQYRGGKF